MVEKKDKQPRLFALENARTPKQHDHMAKNQAAGRCCFCDIDLTVNKIIVTGKYWRVMPNAFPYPAHLHHFIITPIRHVIHPAQLTPAERDEWMRLNLWVIEKYNLPGGAIVMRFGDFKHNAGTVAHLHSHIQVPSGKRFAIAVFVKDAALAGFLDIQDAKYASAQAKKRAKKKK